MYFTRLSVSFKTPYAFSAVLRHNACVFHVFLHSRFFIDLDALRVFLRMASQCMYLTRVSASFKTSFAFSSVWGHNACISHSLSVSFKTPYAFLPIALQCVCFSRFSALAFLYRLRRLTRFPLYGITMHVFYWRFCIDLDVFRVFLRMGSKCVNFTRLSVSFKTPYAVSSVLRHNACVFHVFLHSRLFLGLDVLRVFLRMASQCMCFTGVSASI